MATPKLASLNPGTRAATRYNIKPLIMNTKSPKLNTVIGKVRKISNGRRIAFSKPNNIAVTISEIGFSISTHGSIETTKKIESAVIMVLTMNLFTTFPFQLCLSRNPIK